MGSDSHHYQREKYGERERADWLPKTSSWAHGWPGKSSGYKEGGEVGLPFFLSFSAGDEKEEEKFLL